MLVEAGDLWTKHQEGHSIVIPVNQERKSNGEAIMGAGLAFEAKLMFPRLPQQLGQHLVASQNWRPGFCVYYPDYRLFCLSTKVTWREQAKIETIRRSCELLHSLCARYRPIGGITPVTTLNGPVYLPKLGCGCGRLKWSEVQPTMAQQLPTDSYVVLT